MSDSSSETLRYGDPGHGYQSSVNSSTANSPHQRSPQEEHAPRPGVDHQKRVNEAAVHRSAEQAANHTRVVSKELSSDSFVATRVKPSKYGSQDNRRKSDFFMTSQYGRSYSYQGDQADQHLHLDESALFQSSLSLSLIHI